MGRFVGEENLLPYARGVPCTLSSPSSLRRQLRAPWRCRRRRNTTSSQCVVMPSSSSSPPPPPSSAVVVVAAAAAIVLPPQYGSPRFLFQKTIAHIKTRPVHVHMTIVSASNPLESFNTSDLMSIKTSSSDEKEEVDDTTTATANNNVLMHAPKEPKLKSRKSGQSTSDESVKKLIARCEDYAKCQSFRLDQFRRVSLSAEHPSSSSSRTYKKFFVGGKLRSHQKFGLHWYRTMYNNQINGILADEMGLGKTVQTVAFVCDVLAKENRGPFLVLCPLSVLSHWAKEFALFAPNVRLVSVAGSKEERAAAKSKFTRSWSSNRIPKIQVLLTTYEIILRDRTFFKKTDWKALIVDEGHHLKSSQSKLLAVLKSLTTRSRFILSGTPLQNKIEELWTLLEFLMPHVFRKFTGVEFQKAAAVAAAAAMSTKRNVEARKRPMSHLDEWKETTFGDMDDEDDLTKQSICASSAGNVSSTNTGSFAVTQVPEIVSAIHKIISPFILRRLKSDIYGLKIPPKIVRTIELEMTSEQKTLQNFFLSSSSIERLGPTRTWTIMRRLSVHPQLVERHTVLSSELIYVPTMYEDDAGVKIKALGVLIPRLLLENHRILIFGQLLDALDLIEQFCHYTLFVQTCRIDGKMSSARREEQLNRFNNKEADVMLLSTRAAGLGLNLTSADTVIIFESDYNPMVDEQAQDRCHRIGQTNTVLVLRFRVTPSPYEMLVERLNKEKLCMEKQVIDPLRGSMPGYEISSSRTGGPRQLRLIANDQPETRGDAEPAFLAGGETLVFDAKSNDFLRNALSRKFSAIDNNNTSNNNHYKSSTNRMLMRLTRPPPPPPNQTAM